MIRQAVLSFLIGLVAGLFYAGLVEVSHGQERHHPPQDIALHDSFYSSWYRPDMRDASGHRAYGCCGNHDCYPTQFKRENGVWFFKRRETGKWVYVPDSLIEFNQPDPRESPDGQSHVCDTGANVLCAVIGSGL